MPANRAANKKSEVALDPSKFPKDGDAPRTGVWCMVYGAWRAWCMAHGVWCMVYGVRCAMWRMVYHAR
eukprot:5487556-Lingulodinium_polyedra.AAC.1